MSSGRSLPLRRRRRVSLAILGTCALGVSVLTSVPVGAAPAQATPQPTPPGLDAVQADTVASLEQASGGEVTVVRGGEGDIEFLGAAPGRVLAAGSGSAASSAGRFLGSVSDALGLDNSDLRVLDVQDAAAGQAVRYQQTVGGLPVVGGQVSVQVTDGGGVRSVLADIAPGKAPETTPSISASAAASTAVATTASREQVDAASLTATEPVLSLFDAKVIGRGTGELKLVWQVEVESNDASQPVRELVVVNATDGSVPLLFNQVAYALNREVCDDNNAAAAADHCTAATAVRHEGGPVNADAEVNTAYDYAGDTYNFFKSRFNRDSIDNAGMTLFSTVQYCDPSDTCPYANAFWSGAQMHYGATFASADDVVGHELTHGITQYTSRLFYYYQSGAINEALSDIFGEFIDQTNGAGTDTVATKWKMGEDLPIGAIRDMADPPAHSNPDRMGSSLYIDDVNDAGGVHTNSGVANKASYLITDGGTFNGQTVTGLGLTKAPAIWYQVETAYLLSGSDYANLATALPAACADLIGGSQGITSADCAQVSKAVLATEMASSPPAVASPGPDAPVCDTGVATDLFSDDLENPASGKWAASNSGGTTKWYYPQNTHPYTGFDATYATSGTTNFFGDPEDTIGQASITQSANVAIPAGATAYFRFNRAFGFEYSGSTAYDGGVVEYSTNNGSTWTDAGPLFTHGGYTGTISSNFGNPLSGKSAFTKTSKGYGSSRINLTSLAGQNVRFRFRIGSDNAQYSDGMFVDDIRLYTCAAAQTTGFIRAVTSPAVPSLISVDGVDRDEWGLNWVSFEAGAHTVCFGAVTGFAAPSCQNITVTAGATTTVTGTFTALGYLQVTSSPALPTTISVDGVDVNEYGAWIVTTAGSHTVCFGAVKDYTSPSCRSVAVTAGASASTTGTFSASAGAPGPAAGYGFLRVTTNPAVGATITVDGTKRDNWGLAWLKIAPGAHTVCFEAFPSAAGPGCQAVTVTAGATTTVDGAFTLRGSLRAITSPALDAAITVDGQVANNYGVWRTISVGDHTVCFGAVAGYTAPTCRSVTVTANTTATTTGTYTPA